MATPPRPLLVAPLAAALLLAGCDGLFGPDGGRTRITLSQGAAAGASFSVAVADGPRSDRDGDDRSGGRPAVLALVDGLDVTITAVQAQPAQFVDAPPDDRNWETLTFSAPAVVDLLALPTDSAGLEIVNGDLPPGAYVRLRFLVSEAELRLRAPLTVGRYTFPANEPIPVRVPTPWVQVPGAFFTVGEEAGAVVHVVFDPATSLGQLVVGGDGRLTLTPVMRGTRWREDRGGSRGQGG